MICTTMSNGGKGSGRRPTDKEAYDTAWDRIWGSKKSSKLPGSTLGWANPKDYNWHQRIEDKDNEDDEG